MYEVKERDDGSTYVVVYMPWHWLRVYRNSRIRRETRLRDALVTGQGSHVTLRAGRPVTRRLLSAWTRFRLSRLRPGDEVTIATPADLERLPSFADVSVVGTVGDSWLRELQLTLIRSARVNRVVFDNAERADGERPPLTLGVKRRGDFYRVNALPEGGRANSSSVKDGSKRPRIGVFVHLYYADAAAEMASLLANVPEQHDVIVTTDSPDKAQEIARHLPDARVHVVPNAGRDLGAKFTGPVSQMQLQYEYVLHLHGKRSPQLAAGETPLGGPWMQHIVQALLPNASRAAAIVRYLDVNPHVGMVVPTPWAEIGQTYGWAANRAVADVFCYRNGWPETPEDGFFAFPAGSMFWARTSAIRPLLDLRMSAQDFGQEEASRKDGTLAHALERLLGIVPMWRGYDVAMVAPADDVATPGA